MSGRACCSKLERGVSIRLREWYKRDTSGRERPVAPALRLVWFRVPSACARPRPAVPTFARRRFSLVRGARSIGLTCRTCASVRSHRLA
ncbi:hypothetical protein BRPE64_ACDS14050 [Caballeronia insecticola]|uniref:Uncharacterized protein n=1 Tax=Caballeronia insecticola TaxID=758793 RepID=R4WGW1_9BURK|nr:hypothetical protein BRPE64_ACDS14050 [Caballeronia insecticola]